MLLQVSCFEHGFDTYGDIVKILCKIVKMCFFKHNIKYLIGVLVIFEHLINLLT
jgi:hypothetical protein